MVSKGLLGDLHLVLQTLHVQKVSLSMFRKKIGRALRAASLLRELRIKLT